MTDRIMRQIVRGIAASLLLFAGLGAAHADALRALCPDRPGLGTPACTVDKGHLVAEAGLLDWTRESDSTSRTDTLTGGDLLLRYGLTDSLEVQAGWTAIGHVRTHDKPSSAIDHATGTGDILLGIKQNLHNPSGSGFSIAALPYVTLPTGGKAIGAGDWGAGLIVPVSFALSEKLTLSLTPEVDAAVDEDRNGRHLAYGSVAGLGYEISNAVSATLEAQTIRDRDPDGHRTQTLASVSVAWQPNDAMQWDIGAVAGLNHASPDAELYVGVARRF